MKTRRRRRAAMICRPSRQSPSEPFFLPPTRRRPHAVLFQEVDVGRTRNERTTQSGRSTSGQKFATRQLNEESFLKSKKKHRIFKRRNHPTTTKNSRKKCIFSTQNIIPDLLKNFFKSMWRKKERGKKPRRKKNAKWKKRGEKIKIILCLCIYMDRIIKIMYMWFLRSPLPFPPHCESGFPSFLFSSLPLPPVCRQL